MGTSTDGNSKSGIPTDEEPDEWRSLAEELAGMCGHLDVDRQDILDSFKFLAKERRRLTHEIEGLKAENQRMQMAIHFCSGSCGHIHRDATFVDVTSCDDCYFVGNNVFSRPKCTYYNSGVFSLDVMKSIESGKVPENCPLSKGVLFLAKNS